MINRKLSYGYGESLVNAIEVSAGAEIAIDETIAGGTTDNAVTFALDVSAAVAVYIVSDQAIKIETNGGDAPDATINLAANVPLVWKDSDAAAGNPFGSDDVTGLFVTNDTDAAANLKIRVLYDPTIEE